jgi:hypothetical protein
MSCVILVEYGDKNVPLDEISGVSYVILRVYSEVESLVIQPFNFAYYGK